MKADEFRDKNVSMIVDVSWDRFRSDQWAFFSMFPVPGRCSCLSLSFDSSARIMNVLIYLQKGNTKREFDR